MDTTTAKIEKGARLCCVRFRQKFPAAIQLSQETKNQESYRFFLQLCLRKGTSSFTSILGLAISAHAVLGVIN